MTQDYKLYLLILLIAPICAKAQVDSTAADSIPLPADTLQTAQGDTLPAETTKPPVKIRRWVYHSPLNARLAASDSTLRWNVWPSWVYKKNRDPGVISWRMGSIGRTNTFSVFAHQPKYLELYWEDIRLNSPVTGMVNWNVIPHHKIEKIYEEDKGLTYRTEFYLHEYYLTKPLTKLIYTESKFQFRSLEFMVSRNFGRKTNAEISYWFRRGGGEFDNSEIQGGQIYARVSHHLNDREKLKLTVLNNSYTVGQPFGYSMFSMEGFHFNRFLTSAVESNAESERSSTVINLNYYRRDGNPAESEDNLHAGIFMQTAKRKIEYSADSTYYKVQGFGVNIRKWQYFGPLKAEGTASYKYFINKDPSVSSLNHGNWGLLKTEAGLVFEPLPLLELGVSAAYSARSGGSSEYLIRGSAVFSFYGNLELTTGISTGTRMPTLQQLYWESRQFAGNPDLANEQINEMHARLEADFFNDIRIGLRTQLKQIDNGIMVNSDSVFINLNPYGSLSATGYFNYTGRLFEFYGSVTYNKFDRFLQSSESFFPLDKAKHLWFKAGVYVKGYLFNRATYVKAGFAGILSPQPYQSARYYPSLDFWQARSDEPLIPSFSRLDFDLSARVRTIMVTLRMENILDGLVQQGYFETAYYPMNRRRFLFGIKVLFRN